MRATPSANPELEGRIAPDNAASLGCARRCGIQQMPEPDEYSLIRVMGGYCRHIFFGGSITTSSMRLIVSGLLGSPDISLFLAASAWFHILRPRR